jgi:hypothetical protein
MRKLKDLPNKLWSFGLRHCLGFSVLDLGFSID